MTCIYSGKNCLCEECREMHYAELEYVVQCIRCKKEQDDEDKAKCLRQTIDSIDKHIKEAEERDKKLDYLERCTEFQRDMIHRFVESNGEVKERLEKLEANGSNIFPMVIGAAIALAGVLFFSVISGVMGG